MRGRIQSTRRWRLHAAVGLLAVAALTASVPSWADDTDPPGRVARLSDQSGDVAFAAAGEDSWGQVDVNRPLSIGDRLSTGEDARAELELGGAELRLDAQTALNVVNLDDRNAQIEISGGTVNLHIRHLDSGENYEIDTPTMAFVANQPGIYRIDVFPDSSGTRVRLYQGAGTAYGENNASAALSGHQSFEFRSADLSDMVAVPLPYGDGFDSYCQQRDGRYRQLASAPFVAPEVIGAVDLEGSGEWIDDPDYQHVWYPTAVAADWAPYRQGHWAWIDPWGWTWVDDAPWGFAPFHYGRWVYLRERWGWVPGPPAVRPVYSPALVGFVGGAGFGVAAGGGGPPVGWFPLGPRDVYCPPYHVSRGYFSNVNVTNIRTSVNVTVINNYYDNVQVNRGPGGSRFTPDYAYRNRPEATTVVPREVFAGARPVAAARIGVDARQLAAAPVSFQSPAVPGRASLGVRPGDDGERRPAPSALFDRGAVTHAAAPPAPPSFAARQPLIERNRGQPVAPQQMRQLGGDAPSVAAPDARPASAGPSFRPAMPDRSPSRQQFPASPGNFGDRPGVQPPAEQRMPTPARAPEDRGYAPPHQQELPQRPAASAPMPMPQRPSPPPAPQPMPQPQFRGPPQPPRAEPPRPAPKPEAQPERHEHENHN